MNRVVVAGVLGIVVVTVGCGHTRSGQPRPAGGRPGPVGLEPIPSIHQAINLGPAPLGPEQRPPAPPDQLAIANAEIEPEHSPQAAPKPDSGTPWVIGSAAPLEHRTLDAPAQLPAVGPVQLALNAPAEPRPEPDETLDETMPFPLEELEQLAHQESFPFSPEPEPFPGLADAPPPFDHLDRSGMEPLNDLPPLPPQSEEGMESLSELPPLPPQSEEPSAFGSESLPFPNDLPPLPLADLNHQQTIVPEHDAEPLPIESSTASKTQGVGEWAARVNEDIITWRELEGAVRDRIRRISPDQQPPLELRERIAATVLDELIDRVLILQQARRNELKNPKNWDLISADAEKVWKSERLPILLSQLHAEDEYELERKLADRGDSLVEMQEVHKLNFIAQQYLIHKIKDKVRVDLPEMRTYYFQNRHREEFQRGEQVAWQELAVYVTNHPDRDSARQKIEEGLSRLQGGDDFEAVVQALGEGPNVKQGGHWDTAPNSYSVPAVNDALNTLPTGQVSSIIEGPESFHVVRVEGRQEAGPMSFEEVQNLIREVLLHKAQTEAMMTYLRELHNGAVISTVFQDYRPGLTARETR